jgi:ATP-dependent helicase Lhr and Lhr-like helicase
VVLVDGTPAAYLERGGRSLATFEHPAPAELWLPALRTLVTSGRLRKLELTKVDGAPVYDLPSWPGQLEAAGFTAGHRGFVLRA